MSRSLDQDAHDDALLDASIELLRSAAEPVVERSAQVVVREGRADPLIRDAEKIIGRLFQDSELPEGAIEELMKSLASHHLSPGDLKDIVAVRTQRLAERAAGQWVDLLSDALEVRDPLLLGVDLLPPALDATIGETWKGAPTWEEDWAAVLAAEGLDVSEGVEIMASLRRTLIERRPPALPLGTRLVYHVDAAEKCPALVWARGPHENEKPVHGFTLAAVRLGISKKDGVWPLVPRARKLLEEFVRKGSHYRQATVLAPSAPRQLYCVCDVATQSEAKPAGEHLAKLLVDYGLAGGGDVEVESVETIQASAYVSA